MITRREKERIRQEARKELIEEQICFFVFSIVFITTMLICLF